jgi:hypothetical protein
VTTWIAPIHWIISTIGKHVIAQHALTGGSIGVRIDEPAYFGVVISALEIVQPGLSSIDLAASP